MNELLKDTVCFLLGCIATVFVIFAVLFVIVLATVRYGYIAYGPKPFVFTKETRQFMQKLNKPDLAEEILVAYYETEYRVIKDEPWVLKAHFINDMSSSPPGDSDWGDEEHLGYPEEDNVLAYYYHVPTRRFWI